MKNLIVSMLILITSCTANTDKVVADRDEAVETGKSNLKLDSLDQMLADWVSYYRKIKSNFTLKDFHFSEKRSISYFQGNVYGIFDKEFDSVYYEFLVFSPNKSMYIDFDSYSWVLGDNGKPAFEVDQEINLVTIPSKKVERIGFYGSEEWIEDAFWYNDSVAIVVGNNYQSLPFIEIFDFREDLSYRYNYDKPLENKSEYTKNRFKLKGLS